MNAATIRAADLSLLLASAKLRKYTAGRTPLLAAMSAAPLLECDCHSGRTPTPSWRFQVQCSGLHAARVTPLQRGYISRLFDQVALHRGRREVVKTWGVGIRTLRAESRYVLFGGQA